MFIEGRRFYCERSIGAFRLALFYTYTCLKRPREKSVGLELVRPCMSKPLTNLMDPFISVSNGFVAQMISTVPEHPQKISQSPSPDQIRRGAPRSLLGCYRFDSSGYRVGVPESCLRVNPVRSVGQLKLMVLRYGLPSTVTVRATS